MRTTMTWLVLVLACRGIALAANGAGTPDSGISIPPLDDGRNGGQAGAWEKSGALWQMARQASRAKSWEVERAADELAAREPVKNDAIVESKETPANADNPVPAGDPDSPWLPDSAESLPVVLIVEAVLFAFFAPAMLVGLSISMRRARRRRQREAHVIRDRRSRPAAHPIVAAHLVHAQFSKEESTEESRNEATRESCHAA